MTHPLIPWWCTTRQAKELLGVDSSTLRRNRDRVGGPLQHGVHWLWLNGCSKQGGVRWNVKQIREDHKFRPHNRRKHDIPTSPFER